MNNRKAVFLSLTLENQKTLFNMHSQLSMEKTQYFISWNYFPIKIKHILLFSAQSKYFGRYKVKATRVWLDYCRKCHLFANSTGTGQNVFWRTGRSISVIRLDTGQNVSNWLKILPYRQYLSRFRHIQYKLLTRNNNLRIEQFN